MRDFVQTIYDFYASHKRNFVWRDTDNAYFVFVSEVMLQQTQTSRVIEKFDAFIARFPTVHVLADARLVDVLLVWQGLGYNRRGRFLHEAAKRIVREHEGVIPSRPEALVELPGIGKATASSIAAFAYNVATVFIETNIRSVFIHYFFQGQGEVSDAQIEPLVAASLDKENPRQWYYALMDYGVYLKKHAKNPSRKSKHHVVQSRFEGSNRQIRGAIVRVLTRDLGGVSGGRLRGEVEKDLARPVAHSLFVRILKGLVAEGLVTGKSGQRYMISE